MFFDHDQDRGLFYSFLNPRKSFRGNNILGYTCIVSITSALNAILLLCCEGFQIKKVIVVCFKGRNKVGRDDGNSWLLIKALAIEGYFHFERVVFL